MKVELNTINKLFQAYVVKKEDDKSDDKKDEEDDESEDKSKLFYVITFNIFQVYEHFTIYRGTFFY